MKKLLMTISLLTLSFHSHAQETDSVTVEIEAAYQKYFSDFISRDFSAIASNFQVPAMLGVRSQSYMISKTVTELSVNFEQLNTECMPAPMAGDILFRASASLKIPDGLSIDVLQEALEDLADDLIVEIKLL